MLHTTSEFYLYIIFIDIFKLPPILKVEFPAVCKMYEKKNKVYKSVRETLHFKIRWFNVVCFFFSFFFFFCTAWLVGSHFPGQGSNLALVFCIAGRCFTLWATRETPVVKKLRPNHWTTREFPKISWFRKCIGTKFKTSL